LLTNTGNKFVTQYVLWNSTKKQNKSGLKHSLILKTIKIRLRLDSKFSVKC